MKTYRTQQKVWIWPTNSAPWFFVYIDGPILQEILTVAKKHHAGMVRVEAKIGKTIWHTSLFSHKKENCYIMPIKKSVREKEDVWEGSQVLIELKLL